MLGGGQGLFQGRHCVMGGLKMSGQCQLDQVARRERHTQRYGGEREHGINKMEKESGAYERYATMGRGEKEQNWR